jgi:CHC2 zinc finger
MKDFRRSPPYNPELIDTFQERFINRTDVYPIQKADGGYAAVKQPLTPEVIVGHLRGIHTIGTYALSQQDTGKFLVIDADTEPIWEQVLAMASELENKMVPVWRELSRRGGHLWLFLPALPGLLIRRLATQLLTEHGLHPPQPGQKPIEVYPRQVQLVQNGFGSLVRLPLGVHRMSGKVYPFVDHDGDPLAATPRELLPILAAAKPLALPYILSKIAKSPQVEAPTPTRPFVMREIDPTSRLKPSEKIKARISTVEFIRQYVELDNQGKGYCPFHDDEHKSFNVVESGDYWNCFAGCGGGDLIHFWSKWRAEHGQDGSFTETIKDLLQLLGI